MSSVLKWSSLHFVTFHAKVDHRSIDGGTEAVDLILFCALLVSLIHVRNIKNSQSARARMLKQVMF